jgi:hypothetical protein
MPYRNETAGELPRTQALFVRGVIIRYFGRSSSREITQCAQAWQKEVSSASDRYKLWQTGEAPAQRAIPRNSEVASSWTSGNCFAIAQERVAFFGYTGKLGIRYPRILQELELARNICVETDEV